MKEPSIVVELGPSNTRKNLDLWYSDGSIVLVAESTAFRVHTSILGQNCEVFKDMTRIPKPETVDETEEVFEGCPVVRLQDSTADLEHFLKAIYYHS